MASLWSSDPRTVAAAGPAACGPVAAGGRAAALCRPRRGRRWSCAGRLGHGDWAERAGVPPEPADPPGRRPAGGGRHRPVLVAAATRPCAPGERTRRRRLAPATPARCPPGSAATASCRADARRQSTGDQPGRDVRGALEPSATGRTPGRRCPTGRSDRTTGGPTTRATRAPTTCCSRAGSAVVATGARAGRRTCRLRRAVPLRGRRSTSTCRAGCTARPTVSGWPTEPADTRLGGGIFLHVERARARPSGCVSIPRADDAPAAALAGPGGRPGPGDGTAVGDRPAVTRPVEPSARVCQSCSASLPRSCSTALVCIWQIRLSVTPSTWPISARVRPS